MKKLALALVCLISVAFFASCDPKVENPEPAISVLTEDGYVQNEAIVNLDDTVYFGFTVASNAETGELLSSLVVKIDDDEWETLDLTGLSQCTYKSGVIYPSERDSIVGTSTITAVVTDAAGKTNTASITLYINYHENDLVAEPFEWRRYGGADGTGLEEFGLKWTTNTATNAVIKPLDGAVLYKFNNTEVWANTTTEAQKAALFSELQFSVPQFSDVSVTDDEQDYDIVLGTTYNGVNHLIHVTHSTAVLRSWEFTITGEAK